MFGVQWSFNESIILLKKDESTSKKTRVRYQLRSQIFHLYTQKIKLLKIKNNSHLLFNESCS